MGNESDSTSQRNCPLGDYLWYDPAIPLACQKLFTSNNIKLSLKIQKPFKHLLSQNDKEKCRLE